MEKLSIGMACANDWQGLWSTLLFLRDVNRFAGEIIVVDNAPTTAEGKSVRSIAGDFGTQYIEFDRDHGTSQPRNEVFRQATSEYVLCIDSHVAIPNLGRLTKELADGTIGGDDLFSGPIRMGWRGGTGTHFRDEWGPDGMWGRWGLAWQRADRTGPIFDVSATHGDQGGKARFTTVTMDPQPVDIAVDCDYIGHYQSMTAAGFLPLGAKPDDKPFPIPAMGLGLFLAKRESWLGFHPLARKFGGEEITIHEYYRDHGRQSLCIPWLEWHHRFAADKTNPGYELPNADRARNYVLQVGRLKNKDKFWPGMMEAMTKLIGAEQLEKIVADPDKYPIEGCKTCGQKSVKDLPYEHLRGEDLVSMVRNRPRDIDKQVDTIIEQVAGMETITAVVKRKEWEPVLLASGAKVISFNRENDAAIIARLKELYPDKLEAKPIWAKEIAETDCLVLDTIPNGETLYANLTAYGPQVRKRIILHATKLHGNNGEGGVGMFAGMSRWMKENPEWSVVNHSDLQYGLTTLSREADRRKPLPGILTKAANFAKAMAVHVASGMNPATEEQADIRLSTCSLCKFRNGENCSVCGCVLELKAALASSECPLGHWATAEAAGHPIIPNAIEAPESAQE